jgi:pantothenate kinase type III
LLHHLLELLVLNQAIVVDVDRLDHLLDLLARLVAEARAASGGDAATILTGGWADAVRDVLPDAVVIPDLVLTGIALGAGRAFAR